MTLRGLSLQSLVCSGHAVCPPLFRKQPVCKLCLHHVHAVACSCWQNDILVWSRAALAVHNIANWPHYAILLLPPVDPSTLLLQLPVPVLLLQLAHVIFFISWEGRILIT